MKKIPTLFKREFENHNVVRTLPEVTEGLEWVLNGDGEATGHRQVHLHQVPAGG